MAEAKEEAMTSRKQASVLDSLNPDEAKTVLSRLLESHPNLRAQADQIAKGSGGAMCSTKAKLENLALGQPIDLAVWAVKGQNARCRIPKTNQEITLRASGLWDIVPGEIITVEPSKAWSYAGHPYLSGKILRSRLNIPELGLSPLELKPEGTWDPTDEYWGEGDEAGEWAKPIIQRGPRPEFEMEQVIPGEDPEDPDTDPILDASDLNASGDSTAARKLLMDVLSKDLRCLDAHAHLGNFLFDRYPEEAIRRYEVGVKIGEITLGPDFCGVLPWSLINNRPFLRCLNGFGLCLWRLGRMTEATAIFDRLLWLNPADNQGIRFLLPWTVAGRPWEEQQKMGENVERGSKNDGFQRQDG